MSPLISTSGEPIAGYSLLERIGAGGYGEVWKADAPGGLRKAVKFVYGRLDEERAAGELKALRRVKDVRHPFLLSLERIEVVEGQLIIVTELADSSLKDRYEQCRKSGASGIPREELLKYLRDAADALDYMRREFSLQHLDVKPENLLIVGGRVKVADFGLVKSIEEANMSLPGGMTPSYASPEVFDGRPSLHSDQYSLAVVYQELLTGTLPFPGKTAAQLASQHLTTRPRLGKLPPDDQPIVARALAKTPEERFPSCGAFIAGLREPGPHTSDQRRPAAQGAALGRNGDTAAVASHARRTDADRAPGADDPLSLLRPSGIGPPPELPSCPEPQTGEVRQLQPPDLSLEEVGIRPTLWLGIGGTGARTLRHLRRRLVDRFGSLQSAPALQMILLDTDSKSITAAMRGDAAAAFDARETIAAPLRNPQHYRARSGEYLRWLGRRWLYNLPRSKKTEGFRPLGRLAFVDHAGEIATRLREALASITDPEHLAATTKATGLKFRDQTPRIFVVASISGGTGSGMVFDAARMLRETLADLGLSDEGVCGILMHSTGRESEQKALAVANAYTWLREWQHYHGGHSEPGDSTGESAAVPGGKPPLPNVYLVHMGEDLDDKDFDAAADDVAAYLYLDAATAGGVFFDECRKSSSLGPEQGDPEAGLRTFGLCQVGCSHGAAPAMVADQLCRDVLDSWRHEPDDPQQPQEPAIEQQDGAETAQVHSDQARDCQVHRLAADQARKLELGLDELLKQADDVADAELGGPPKQRLDGVLSGAGEQLLAASAERANRPLVEHVLDSVNAILGRRNVDRTDGGLPRGVLGKAIGLRLHQFVEDRGGALCAWLWEMIETPGLRIDGARRAAKWLDEHLRRLETDARQRARSAAQQISPLENVLLANEWANRRRASSRLRRGLKWWQAWKFERLARQYLQLRIVSAALECVCKCAQLVRNQVSTVVHEMVDLQHQLDRLGREFDTAEPSQGPESHDGRSCAALERLRSSLLQRLQSRRPELAEKLDRELQEKFPADQGGVRGALMRSGYQANLFNGAVRETARAIVLRTLMEAQVVEDFFPETLDGEQDCSLLNECLELAAPPLLTCGGAQRLLLALPDGWLDAQTQRRVKQCPPQTGSVISHPTGDVLLCFEAEQLDAYRVGALVVNRRQECVLMSSRLHSRVDVAWLAQAAS